MKLLDTRTMLRAPRYSSLDPSMRHAALGYMSRLRGYVYFVQAGTVGPIKIGTSVNVKDRMASIQVHCPEPLRLLGVTRGGLVLEQAFHRRFAAHRLHHEWFEPCPPIFKLLNQLRDWFLLV